MFHRHIKVLSAICLIILLFSGCVVTSIYPLYTENDTPVFDKELVGTWHQNDDYWMFEKDQDKSENTPDSESKYRLFVFDGKTTGKFQAVLFPIGNKRFLDIFPADPEEANEWYYWHLLPSHSFYLVEIKDDELRLGYVDYESFEDMIKENRADIDYMEYDDRYFFTAKPEALQAFILRCAEHNELTTEVYKRQSR
ncbi:MAG: hypothetical protein JXB48_04230 [Candidatus Latescibacteria bacterium]|nr:hypothetical protein [Candidatus Latescibacterota bacterium]